MRIGRHGPRAGGDKAVGLPRRSGAVTILARVDTRAPVWSRPGPRPRYLEVGHPHGSTRIFQEVPDFTSL